MMRPPVAFKLLCDPQGTIIGVEAGDQEYLGDDAKTGQIFVAAQSIEVGLGWGEFKMTVPPPTVSEVTVVDVQKAGMRCCWRMINGRWVCVPC